MNKIELENYLSKRVLIVLADGSQFKGYFSRFQDENIILSSCQYKKDKAIAIKDIISIKLLFGFWERQRRFFFRK